MINVQCNWSLVIGYSEKFSVHCLLTIVNWSLIIEHLLPFIEQFHIHKCLEFGI